MTRYQRYEITNKTNFIGKSSDKSHFYLPKRSSARLKRKRTPDPEQKSSEATKRNKRTKISEKTSSQSKEKQSTRSTIEQTDIPAKPTDSKHRSVGAHVSIQGG